MGEQEGGRVGGWMSRRVGGRGEGGRGSRREGE